MNDGEGHEEGELPNCHDGCIVVHFHDSVAADSHGVRNVERVEEQNPRELLGKDSQQPNLEEVRVSHHKEENEEDGNLHHKLQAKHQD